MITIGAKIIYGTDGPVLPLRGFPEGRARIRRRKASYTRVFIRPPQGGIHEFLVIERDGYWEPYGEIGVNITVFEDKTFKFKKGTVICPVCGSGTFIDSHTPATDHPECSTDRHQCNKCEWHSDEWPTKNTAATDGWRGE